MSLYVCHCNCLSGCGKCVVLYFAFVVEKFKSNPLMVEAFSRIRGYSAVISCHSEDGLAQFQFCLLQCSLIGC